MSQLDKLKGNAAARGAAPAQADSRFARLRELQIGGMRRAGFVVAQTNKQTCVCLLMT